jgi:hypothetical protein
VRGKVIRSLANKSLGKKKESPYAVSYKLHEEERGNMHFRLYAVRRKREYSLKAIRFKRVQRKAHSPAQFIFTGATISNGGILTVKVVLSFWFSMR